MNQQKCSSCQYHFAGDSKAPRHCTRFPPRGIPQEIVHPITQKPELGVIALPNPVMPTDLACGEYKPRLSI